jgi:hypothetical protein
MRFPYLLEYKRGKDAAGKGLMTKLDDDYQIPDNFSCETEGLKHFYKSKLNLI